MNRKFLVVMSLALALPTSIMVISYIVYTLVENHVIHIYAGAAIIVCYIAAILFMMVKGANSKNN